MTRCKSCSAALSGVICRYCGTRNNIDLENVRSFTNVRPMQLRDCPVCHHPMKTIDIGKKIPFLIERCDSCYGLFFDHNELESMIESSIKGSRNVDLEKLNALTENPRYIDVIVYRRCPVCKTLMNRKNYAQRSGVVMDVCAEHGIWLDPGELRHILEWVKSGGEQRDVMKHSNPSRYVTQKSRPHYPHKIEEKSDYLDVLDILGGLFRW